MSMFINIKMMTIDSTVGHNKTVTFNIWENFVGLLFQFLVNVAVSYSL